MYFVDRLMRYWFAIFYFFRGAKNYNYKPFKFVKSITGSVTLWMHDTAVLLVCFPPEGIV